LRPLQQSSPQPRWAGFPVHTNKLQGIQAKANKKAYLEHLVNWEFAEKNLG